MKPFAIAAGEYGATVAALTNWMSVDMFLTLLDVMTRWSRDGAGRRSAERDAKDARRAGRIRTRARAVRISGWTRSELPVRE
jgi:hypothetical protein